MQERYLYIFLLFLAILIIVQFTSYNLGPSYAQDAGIMLNVTTSGNANDHNLATTGSNLYVTWSDQSTGNGDIYFRASGDNGLTFGETVNISDDSSQSGNPLLSTSDKNVYVLWSSFSSPQTGTLQLKISNNNGLTFGETVNISNPGFPLHASIETSGNNTYVTWLEGNPFSRGILFRASNTSGESFSNVINLDEVSGFFSIPKLYSSDKNVYVLWSSFSSPQTGTLQLKISNNNGLTFGETVNISNPGFPLHASIETSGNNTYVSWSDGSPRSILFRESNNSDSTFGQISNLSGSIGNSIVPRMATSATHIYVVWNQFTSPEISDVILWVKPTNLG
jgi:hypothetical protein